MEERQVRLRPDADVRPDPEDPEHFLLRHPVTNRHARITFEQAAILYYLDGRRDLAGLAAAASEHSGSEITPPDVESFVAELDHVGLIDTIRASEAPPSAESAVPPSPWRGLESRHARRIQELRSELLAERERAAEEAREAEQRRLLLEEALRAAETRLEEMQRSAGEEHSEFERRIEAQRSELLAERDRAETEIREAERQRHLLQEALTSAERRLEELQRSGREERLELESRIDGLTRRAESTEQELAARGKALSDAESRVEADLAASREGLERAVRESEELRQERDTLAAALAEAKSQPAGKEEQAVIESRIEELACRAESMAGELAARAEALQDAETRFEAHLSASQDEAATATREREALMRALAEAEEQLARVHQENIDLSAGADCRVRELERRIEELEGEVSQLKQELAARDEESARAATPHERPAGETPPESGRSPLTEQDLAPLTLLEEQARRFQQLLSDAVSQLQRDTDIRPQLESHEPRLERTPAGKDPEPDIPDLADEPHA